MPRKKFDLIVFDWDGTLMDSTTAIVRAIQAAAKDVGVPVPKDDAAAHVIGLGLAQAMEVAMPGLEPSLYPKILERYRYHYLTRDHEIELFDGVHDMLAELADSAYFLAVATGKSRVGLNRALNATGLLSTFHATRCADETFSKPHPAMLQELTRELGQDLRRTVMIGDTTHDLLMAANAGAHGIAVQYGAHPVEQLHACDHVFSATSVHDLHEWLKEHA
ncbi:MAG: HAD-IIIA family hydrolase [Telluria sp.]